MKFELSNKAKWTMIVGIPLAMAFSVWIGSSNDIDRLVHMAKKGDQETKLIALEELASYGSSASGAIDDLHSLIISHDQEVRRAAARAIIQIDHQAAVNIFTKAMSSSDAGVRIDAREGLEQIGTQRASIVASKISEQTEMRNQRARIKSGWFKQMKKTFEREKEEQYRHHRKIYGQ